MNPDATPSPWRQILTLADWAFLWAFPTDEDSFMRAHGKSEFCNQAYDWPDFYKRALQHFEKQIVPLVQLGLTLRGNCTLADLNWALRHKRGVVLFSHCNSKSHCIEFGGGAMAAPEAVVQRVPRDFAGIFDLSVCSPPKSLPLAIKTVAPACGVAYTDLDLPSPQWINIYACMLSYFVNGSDYYSADTACKNYFAGL